VADYLVTGASGSVGKRLVDRLYPFVAGVDIEEMDVTDPVRVREVVKRVMPEVIFHLAGAKHAFEGELDPAHAASVNIGGTQNVLREAAEIEAKVVFASTCKACDPETAYGASKLIAERLVLNAGGVVVRYFNIPESSGNVFRLWESLSADEPIPYTDCWRYFISMEQAIDLTVAAAEWPSGRYMTNPGPPRKMRDVAAELYPGRELIEVPRRRGDRYREPLLAECETLVHTQIHSPYDWQGVRLEREAAVRF
jgi:FlaA1/EpsC-like NDP-sugar epimerase